MRVRVRGYLTFRGLIGQREIALEDGATLRTLIARLAGAVDGAQAPIFAPPDGLQPGVGLLINGRHHTHTPDGLDTVLRDGDEVAVFPPLAGG